jgi:hypothetical protein
MDRQFTKQGNHLSRCRRGEVDPVSLDSILMETARLSERAEMYFRFLRRRLSTDLESVSKGEKLTSELRELDNWIGNTKLRQGLIFVEYIFLKYWSFKIG